MTLPSRGHRYPLNPSPPGEVPRHATALCGAAVVIAMLCAACNGGADRGAVEEESGPGDVAAGAEAFASNCAQCHGVDADGSTAGPSFLNDIYVPSHHGDTAFLNAVRNGVQPHHWDFGAMPPIPGLSNQDVANIIAWVRHQQREAGVTD